jgi:hypothetical protein
MILVTRAPHAEALKQEVTKHKGGARAKFQRVKSRNQPYWLRYNFDAGISEAIHVIGIGERLCGKLFWRMIGFYITLLLLYSMKLLFPAQVP